MFDNQNQNVLNATLICTETWRISILCAHRIFYCISRKSIDLFHSMFPVQRMLVMPLRHCHRQRCFRMVAPATVYRGIYLRAIYPCRIPSTWRNRSFCPRTIDWWSPTVVCPWTFAPMCRTWHDTILECRAVARPRSNPNRNCALNRSFRPTFYSMFANSGTDVAIGTEYFWWDRCHRIPNCTAHCEIRASCTALAVNCSNSRSLPGWPNQRNRTMIASMMLKRDRRKLDLVRKWREEKCWVSSLTWIKAYCFAVRGRRWFFEQWQRYWWTVRLHWTGWCAKSQFIVVQWICDGGIRLADRRTSLCQIVRWRRHQFYCCALWRFEINAHLGQCFHFMLRDYHLKYNKKNRNNIFLDIYCYSSDRSQTSSPSFDVCITMSKLSTSNWVLMSLNNCGTVFDGRTINVIFFLVAPGIKFEMMHCALPSSLQTISINGKEKRPSVDCESQWMWMDSIENVNQLKNKYISPDSYKSYLYLVAFSRPEQINKINLSNFLLSTRKYLQHACSMFSRWKLTAFVRHLNIYIHYIDGGSGGGGGGSDNPLHRTPRDADRVFSCVFSSALCGIIFCRTTIEAIKTRHFWPQTS